MYDEINYERLRNDLMNYFGAAMMYYPVAVVELSEVEHASPSKLIQIAIQNGFDVDNYKEQKTKKY